MKTMTLEEIKFIRDTVFETVEFKKDVDIEFFDAEGITVEYDGKKAKIGADSKPGLARGCFLLAMELDAGKKNISIQEKAHFKTCGLHVDCSRNGVVKVESFKQYMNRLACLGFNTLMLYIEDTYEIPSRPRFGYLRGRYTKEEIQELVAYGEKLGIELIPSMQTLGHLGNYLKWDYACKVPYEFNTGENIDQIMNAPETLLVDCEETYRFIEDEIRACKEAFKTDRIHIGMDESTSAYRGKFLEMYGIQSKFEVFTRHLRRVVDICKKYGLKPMIWSDMIFHAFSEKSFYYDPNVVFPEEFKETFPEVDLAYWDYRVTDADVFEKMIKKHQELGRDVGFFNTLGTHVSPLVAWASPWAAFPEGLKACLRNNIQTVVTTIWGDDGNLCNYRLCDPLLAVLSEYCYKGEACTEDDIKRVSEYLTKIPFAAAAAMSDGNCIVEPVKEWRLQAKRMLFGDVLYDMACDLEYCDAIIETYGAHAELLKQQMKAEDKNYEWYRYAKLIYEIGVEKAWLRKKLQKAYLENDREYLRSAAEEILPRLADTMGELAECHRMQWESTYKAFGFEVHCFRYGGAIARLHAIAAKISRYLAGELSCIEELDAERIPNGLSFRTVKQVVTPSSIF